MCRVGIGTSNRGLFDREDQLYIKQNPLRVGLSAQEAENFAKNNSGAEAIIKNQDGTYSVYQMETSEDGKTIDNKDFTNDYINLTSDVAKQMAGKKAYVMTNDNVIRSLEIKGIEFPTLEQRFGNANVSLELTDKDGIETKSKNDLEGILSGNITMTKESLEYSLAQASKSMGVDLKLSVNPNKNEYVITVNKGIDLGYITLKMGQGGINAKFDLSTAVNAAGYALSPVGMLIADPEKMITDFIRNKLSKDIGMKPESVSRNEIRLTPDFKNNKLISQIPVGDMNVNLEGVKSNNMNFKVDGRGDLQIDLGRTVVTASSDGNGALTQGTDIEGGDKIKTNVVASIGNDLSGTIKTNSSVEVNITNDEKAQLSARMEKLAGMGLSISGEAKVTDIKVDAKLDNGKLSVVNQGSGKVSAKNLSVGMGSSTLNVNSADGELGVKEDGSKVIVNARNIDIKGGIDSPATSLNFKKMQMNGDIIYDKNNPNKIKLEGDKTKGITLSVDMKDKTKNTTISVDEFNIKGTDIEVDMAKRNISLKPQDPSASITIDKIKMGDNVNLKNVLFRGNLDINAFTGKMVLDSKTLAFNGKVGDVQIDNLRASGKMTYDPNSGIKIEGLNLQNASGKIGNFELSKVKAKGEISFDKAGNLNLSSIQSFQMDSKTGLKASGNATVAYKDGILDFTVKPNKPFNITYKPDKKEQAFVTGQFEGNIKYNTNTSTFSFNNADKPFKVKQGSIAGNELKNFSLNGEVNIGNDGVVTLSNSKGETSVSGSIAGINLKELKSDSPIILDSKNKSINMNGNVSIELPDQKLKVSTTGNVSLSQRPDGKIVLDSKDGTINGNIAGIDVENFKIQGKVIFDPKTGNINLEGQDSNPFKVTGKVLGKSFDLESSGTLNLSKENGNTKISTQGIPLKGNIEGFNIESKEGVKGNLTLSPEGKLLGVEGFNFDFSVDGISLKNSGGLTANDNGYQINLSGEISQDANKLPALLQKLSENPMIPESSKAGILKAQEQLSKINLQNLKYENLNIDFGKDLSFNKISVTAKELNFNYPEKAMVLNSTGSVTFDMDKTGKMSVTSKEQVINATIAGTEYKDFKLNGKMDYDPDLGKISFSGLNKQDVTLNGKIGDKVIDLSSDATISLSKKGDDLEFSGNEMNLKGNIDGFKIESLSGASGKFLLKPDGHIDLSNLKFDFKVDDVIISNKNGSVKGSDDGYSIKLSGNLQTTQNSLFKLLDKIAINSTTPENARHAIQQTVKNIRDYMVTGDIKNASYDNFQIELDRGLNFKGFNVDTKATMENTSINIGLGADKNKKLNLGTVDVVSNIRGMDSNFTIKDGSVSFALTPDVKKAIGEEVKNIMAVYGLKDMDVSVNDDGTIKVNKATYEGLPIVNVDLGATAKFEGTKVNIVIDKANIKGFFGRIAQKVAEGVGGFDSRVLGTQEAVKRMNDLKVNYNGGDRSFSLDLKEVLYQNIGDDFHLTNAKFENGRFNMNFDVTVGATKPFNPSNVVDGTNKIKGAISSNKQQDRPVIRDFILKQEAQDLSRILDKITILQLKSYLKDDANIVPVMKKLADIQNIGHNAQHLKEFSSLVNDSQALAFVNTLDTQSIRAMSIDTKVNLLKTLAKGRTDSDEEEAMKKLLINSDSKDIKKLIDIVGKETIIDEIDSNFYNQLIALAV